MDLFSAEIRISCLGVGFSIGPGCSQSASGSGTTRQRAIPTSSVCAIHGVRPLGSWAAHITNTRSRKHWPDKYLQGTAIHTRCIVAASADSYRESLFRAHLDFDAIALLCDTEPIAWPEPSYANTPASTQDVGHPTAQWSDDPVALNDERRFILLPTASSREIASPRSCASSLL